jgi:hypothetical protein
MLLWSRRSWPRPTEEACAKRSVPYRAWQRFNSKRVLQAPRIRFDGHQLTNRRYRARDNVLALQTSRPFCVAYAWASTSICSFSDGVHTFLPTVSQRYCGRLRSPEVKGLSSLCHYTGCCVAELREACLIRFSTVSVYLTKLRKFGHREMYRCIPSCDMTRHDAPYGCSTTHGAPAFRPIRPSFKSCA